jgi:hypothetical protein
MPCHRDDVSLRDGMLSCIGLSRHLKTEEARNDIERSLKAGMTHLRIAYDKNHLSPLSIKQPFLERKGTLEVLTHSL